MKLIRSIAAMIVCASCLASAQGKGFGLGVILGEPTGISAKGWISPRGAVDAGFAWSSKGSGSVHAHMDYLWHLKDVVNTSQQVLPYIGVGGRILGSNNGSSVLGVRIAGGISWLPADTPLDVFLELAPIVDLTPQTQTSVNSGVGVRFYFR